MIAALAAVVAQTDRFDGLVPDFDPTWFAEPYLELLGGFFPTIVGFVLLTTAFIFTGGVATPSVLAIILGGLFMTTMPAGAQTVGMLFIVAGIAGGLYSAYSGQRGVRL